MDNIAKKEIKVENTKKSPKKERKNLSIDVNQKEIKYNTNIIEIEKERKEKEKKEIEKERREKERKER